MTVPMKGQPHDRNVEKGWEMEENKRKKASLEEKERGREWWGEQWAPEAVAGIEAMAAAATLQMRTGEQTLIVEKKNSMVVGQMAALAAQGPLRMPI